MTKHSPFRYFKTSPEIIHLAVMLYVRFPLALRNVEDLLHERGIEISHETVRFWWNRFGPMFAAEIRRNRVSRMRSYSNWQWHLVCRSSLQSTLQSTTISIRNATSTHETISRSIEPPLLLSGANY